MLSPQHSCTPSSSAISRFTRKKELHYLCEANFSEASRATRYSRYRSVDIDTDSRESKAQWPPPVALVTVCQTCRFAPAPICPATGSSSSSARSARRIQSIVIVARGRIAQQAAFPSTYSPVLAACESRVIIRA